MESGNNSKLQVHNRQKLLVQHHPEYCTDMNHPNMSNLLRRELFEQRCTPRQDFQFLHKSQQA